MLAFLAGLIIFIVLFSSKFFLAKVILTKKQVALSVFVIVVSEVLIFAIPYYAIRKFGLDSKLIISGFLVALLLMIVYFGLRFFKNKN